MEETALNTILQGFCYGAVPLVILAIIALAIVGTITMKVRKDDEQVEEEIKMPWEK